MWVLCTRWCSLGRRVLADLEAALRAIGADSHDVVRLEAEPETLRLEP
jgi:hypothetical protein